MRLEPLMTHDDARHPSPDQLLRQLQQAVETVSSLSRDLETVLESPGVDRSGKSASEAATQAELDRVRVDRDEITERFIEAEQKASRVMTLYVATHQLHATLTPKSVYAAIAEVAVDLLGAASFALLLRGDNGDPWRIALARGVEQGVASRFAHEHYPGGDRQVDATIEDGILRIGEKEGGTDAIAVVPLRVDEGFIIGVLAIFEVFGHKVSPLREDRELLDLLSAHVGSALLSAERYLTTDRRLRTLKDLVSLLPDGA